MKNNTGHISDEERARLIDEAARTGNSLASGDAFLARLTEARQAVNEQHAQNIKTDRNWPAVEAGMTAQKNEAETEKRSPVVFYLSLAAAAVLLAAIIGGIYLLLLQQQTHIYQTADTRAEYTLPDGTEVVMRPNTRLEQLPSENLKRSWMLTGEAWFEVKPDERPFTIQTPQAVVRVEGTTFNLSSWGETSRLFLDSGSVTMSTIAGDESHIINPGEYAELGETGFIVFPELSDKSLSLGWKTERIMFENRPVGSIAAELEFHFGIRIELPEEISNQTLSGTIMLTDRAIALSDLERVLGGAFTHQGGGKWRFER